MNVGWPLQAESAHAVRGAAARCGDQGFVPALLTDPGAAFLLSAVCAPYAVGMTAAGPLIQRWDGEEWSGERLPVLGPGVRGAALTGVHSTGASAVAVGGAFDVLAGEELPLLLRRTHAGWADDRPPDLGFPYVLTDVVDGWAVGHGFPGTVLLHRLGGSWTPVVVPGRPARLLAVAVHGDELWVAGARNRDGLLLRCEGGGWKEFRPRTGAVTCLAASSDELWAAAGRSVLRWTGRRWIALQAPFPANALTLVDGAPRVAGSGFEARYDGRRWNAREVPGTWLGADEDWLVGSG
ncbi:hypothetical protein [Actinocorallia longicatena]|uniref:Uncharacterized protein n=1 Tax=Actinocorallia longicatena TaxID=111803 RepID=A0ABP6PXQ8_9ACTN